MERQRRTPTCCAVHRPPRSESDRPYTRAHECCTAAGGSARCSFKGRASVQGLLICSGYTHPHGWTDRVSMHVYICDLTGSKVAQKARRVCKYCVCCFSPRKKIGAWLSTKFTADEKFFLVHGTEFRQLETGREEKISVNHSCSRLPCRVFFTCAFIWGLPTPSGSQCRRICLTFP